MRDGIAGPDEVLPLFVPGRICLFGEHSDWAGAYRDRNPEIEKGYALIMGTDQGIHALVRTHPTDLVLTAIAPDGTRTGPHTMSMDPGALLAEAEAGGFWSYVAGVAYRILQRAPVGGLVLDNDRTDLPMRRGLSSSAAISVLTARAFNRLYDLGFSAREEMEIAYLGETTTPSRCGRMDQGCAFGRRPILMTFDGERLDVEEVQAGADLFLVIVDLLTGKDTTRILARLHEAYPIARDDTHRALHDLLGAWNRRIVHDAASALRSGNAERLGALMTEAQALFDRHAAILCPEDLTAPALHRVLADEAIAVHIWGGKGVGSQGDGAAQLLARSEADQQAVIEILRRDLGLPSLALTVRAPRRVRKAVIPAAGFGTRMFPATRSVKKELFPIIDRDGVAKPAILLIVEEAIEAGIEEVILIVQEADLPEFQALFHDELPPEKREKLAPEQREAAHRLIQTGRHVSFCVQAEQHGLGHAVFQASGAVGGEPFLLMLGDHLYRSTGARSCSLQVLDAYARKGISVLGLVATPADRLGEFGAAAGTWSDEAGILDLTEVVEKPTIAYAKDHLEVPGLPSGRYLTLLGQYVLSPEVFSILAEHARAGRRDGGELQLTPALEDLRKSCGMAGLLVHGRRFDIGNPAGYRDTVTSFARPEIAEDADVTRGVDPAV